nr:transient receptor potential channel pyrexia-like isoform X1 [Leptinotarsa decemlineata]XP_023024380.1 transient receptor potential channel pyrexia-like isoform X2 [Leptinotarsa decemlineata]XP_023024381.1 transient receptor potential channel pyrexia-like isoform X3 [Leptinotarsa decemlineata]
MEKRSLWTVLQNLRWKQTARTVNESSIPLRSSQRRITIQRNTSSHEDEFIDCGPSPPVDQTPFVYDNFDEVETGTVVKMCYNTIEGNLIDHMKMGSGRTQLLEGIQNRTIHQDNFLDCFRGASQVEINVSFLWASFSMRWDILEQLVSLGAQLNYYEPAQGLGALHLAAFSGCIPGTQFLINRGCNVNALFKCYTPLHCAAFGDSPDTALILLHKGARLADLTNSPYEPKESALHCAIRANAVSCVRVLVNEEADVKQMEFSGSAPLHLAADLGNTECLQILLEVKGIDVNIRSPEKQQTPLHLASMRGYGDCVDLLLRKGANPNAKNHMGQSPLHFAARTQDFMCVELLLKKGYANPNTEDYDKRTPLHAAVAKSTRSSDIIESLVSCGGKVNVKDQYGYTPLHIAALKGLAECVETLIYHGADVTAKSKSGVTALNIITKKVPASFSMFTKKLDSAISLHHKESSNQELELRLDFAVILKYCYPREINFLDTLIDEGYKKVLLHPLCSALLHLKWEKIRKYYLARIMFSCIFVLSLSLYVLTALAHHCYNYGKNFAEMDAEELIDLCEKSSIMGKLLRDNPFAFEMQWFVLVGITICEIFRKLYGISGYHSVRQYFSYSENIIEWFVIASVFVISFIYTGRTYTWQNHVGAFAVLLGWTNLMLMVGQLPSLGSYVAMYTRVQSEFAKLLLAYSGLLIGFTLTFCVIFPDSDNFANPFISLVTIIVMLSGELNLDILVEPNPESPHFLLEISAQVTYVIFVFSATIILMNLLVGIAVDDIKGLQKTATLCKLVRQTKLISQIELGLFNGNLPRYLIKLLRWTALVSPQPSKVVLNLKPLNPLEKRLPKEIMRAAFHVAEKYGPFHHYLHTLNDGLNYYWINQDLNGQDKSETAVQLALLQEEVKMRNEKIDVLTRTVADMKATFKENQETLEAILRALVQTRKGSRF